MELPIKLYPGGQAPSYQTKESAGLDLFAALPAPLVIEPKTIGKIPFGFAMELPPHHVAFLHMRSGISVKNLLMLPNGVGVIDSDYRGEIMCYLYNAGEEAFTVKPGDRVAQLVIQQVVTAKVIPTEALSATARGEGGFGSTGIAKTP